MHVTAEIQTKEKSLADLMARILQEPFKPLRESIQKLENTSLDSEEKLEAIHNALELFADDAEKTKKDIAKPLRNISEEDLPKITNELNSISKKIIARFLEANDQHSKIVNAIYELKTQYRINNEISSASQTKNTQTILNEIKSNRDFLENHQIVLTKQLTTFSAMLENHMSTSTFRMQATLDEIKVNREFNEKATADLGIQLKIGVEILTTKIRENFASINAVVTQQMHTGTTAIALMERQQTASINTQGQLNEMLLAKNAITQKKLDFLISIVVILFILILSQITYNIWGNIN